MNLYGDLYDKYGHYSDEMFRACRLVVDTGLHAFGWTREQAIDYILEHTAMSRIDVEVILKFNRNDVLIKESFSVKEIAH